MSPGTRKNRCIPPRIGIDNSFFPPRRLPDTPGIRRTKRHDRRIYAGRLCSGVAVLALFCGITAACREGLKCHYGRDIEMLKDWAFQKTGCLECADGPCECNYYDSVLQVSTHGVHSRKHPRICDTDKPWCVQCDREICSDRRTQVLLSHPPTGCSAGFYAVWRELARQCSRSEGICCPDCEGSASTQHCTTEFTTLNQIVASSYTATIVALAILSIRSRSTVRYRTSIRVVRPAAKPVRPSRTAGTTSFFF